MYHVGSARSRSALLRGVGSVLDIGATGYNSRHATTQRAWSRVAQAVSKVSRRFQAAENPQNRTADPTLTDQIFRLWELQLDALYERWREFENSDEYSDLRADPRYHNLPWHFGWPWLGYGYYPPSTRKRILTDRHYRTLIFWRYSYYQPRFLAGVTARDSLEELRFVILYEFRISAQMNRPPVRYLAYLYELYKTMNLEYQIFEPESARQGS